MKAIIKKLTIVFLIAFVSTAIIAGCTGNTDFTWFRGGTEWCCAFVGDGTDASCTDGNSWHLFSELWENPAM